MEKIRRKERERHMAQKQLGAVTPVSCSSNSHQDDCYPHESWILRRVGEQFGVEGFFGGL
jgi:hypothetical protein